MDISVAQQGWAMVQSLLLGAGAGLAYDLCRVLRVRLKLWWVGALLDLLFWPSVTAVLFVWSLDAWGGWVRLYGAAGVLVGGAVYFVTFSRPVLSLAYHGADVVTILLRLVLMPMKGAFFLLKKIEIFAKNSFHYVRKWYKIRQPKRNTEQGHRRKAGRRDGGGVRAGEKSGAANQDFDPGAADLHGHPTAGHPRSAGRGKDRAGRAGHTGDPDAAGQP